MRSYCVKLWDNSTNFFRGNNAGFIETLYLRAPSISQAVTKALQHAKKQDYTSCRVCDVCEIDETVIP